MKHNRRILTYILFILFGVTMWIRGLKGIVDEFRRKKLAFNVVKDIFNKYKYKQMELKLSSILFVYYNTITRVPAPISTHPIRDFTVNCSCKNTNPRIRVITTLSLSMGTTLDTVPICKAL